MAFFFFLSCCLIFHSGLPPRVAIHPPSVGHASCPQLLLPGIMLGQTFLGTPLHGHVGELLWVTLHEKGHRIVHRLHSPDSQLSPGSTTLSACCPSLIPGSPCAWPWGQREVAQTPALKQFSGLQLLPKRGRRGRPILLE